MLTWSEHIFFTICCCFARVSFDTNIFDVYFDMQSHLENTYCKWGYLVSELVFVSRKYKIYWQILFYTFLYKKRSVYNSFPRTQNKYQPRSQGLSSYRPLERAGHVSNVGTEVE